MVERRFKTDICEIDASKIDSYEHDTLGPVTVFKDVVIARAIVHKYDDGMAYKPGKELQAGYWTADGMWAISGGHPATAIIATRDEIQGRTANVRFSRSLIDPKTDRPMNRGILADLEVFNNRVSPELLSDMKAGKKNEVSIGFFFDFDDTSGVVDDEDDKALKGTAYDYVQRNITINHVAFGIDNGRCPMPYCGIGADGVIRKQEGDPVGPYKTFALCVAAIMKKNPSYTKKQAEGTCGKMEQQEKEEDFKPTDDNNLSMKTTIADAKVYLRDVLSKLDSIEFAPDDLVEEEYQGNAGTPMTLSERAKMFHSISDDDWDALTEAEKEGYIDSLPPEKPHGESNKDGEEDCIDCDEELIKQIALDLSLEQIDAKLEELKKSRDKLREQIRKLDDKLYSEPDAEKKRKADLRKQINELWGKESDLYDEIHAYSQAKTLKITQSALVDDLSIEEMDERIDELKKQVEEREHSKKAIGKHLDQLSPAEEKQVKNRQKTAQGYINFLQKGIDEDKKEITMLEEAKKKKNEQTALADAARSKTTETTEDELNPDEVIAKYKRTLADKDYPY